MTVLKNVRCPICRRPVPLGEHAHRPFCSERCRLQDVANWASDRYRIPVPTEAPPTAPTDDDDKAE